MTHAGCARPWAGRSKVGEPLSATTLEVPMVTFLPDAGWWGHAGPDRWQIGTFVDGTSVELYVQPFHGNNPPIVGQIRI